MNPYDRNEPVTLLWSEGSPNTDDKRECSLFEAVRIVVEDLHGLPKQSSSVILRAGEPIRKLDEMRAIYSAVKEP